MPSIENAKWQPPNKILLRFSVSRDNLRKMKVGECKRITHDDLKCYLQKHKTNSYVCSLSSMISLEGSRKPARVYEHYHEKAHVAIVKRIR
jgi:hypothetical protein